MKRVSLLVVLSVGFVLSNGSGNPRAAANAQNSNPADLRPPVAASTAGYALVAWSELGMHCIDGKDYSVFSVLPPYNIIHAQLIQKTEPPTIITTGVTMTYQSTADTKGSVNSSSSGKTNFWTYVNTLFLANVPPETGLAGYKTQSSTPNKMNYNATLGYWEAVGIPTVPYDDKKSFNPYPMAILTARDSTGTVLATAKIVLAVSDEMSCKNCHASGTDKAAEPASGWVYNSDPLKDPKLNILKKHDDKWPISQYLSKLQAKGYTYQSSLYETAISGTPVLCSACHSDNALAESGLSGINSFSADMHDLHGPQVNPATGITLDKTTGDLNSCYLCHPGPTTQCKRGAMNQRTCANCHGNVSYVGSKSTRNPWLVEPSCQMCHNTSQRFTSTFASNGQWRQTTDLTFATNANVPVPGTDLYRYSKGHGSVFCSGCHGSPHAEYPTLQANDNVYPVKLQGYAAKITECAVCHASVLAATGNGGPHGVHIVGQAWVDAHHDYVDSHGSQSCAYCHGATYRGSALSQAKAARTFNAGDFGTKTFPAGHQFNCYDCHNGPNGG
jgi:hypothetical protein